MPVQSAVQSVGVGNLGKILTSDDGVAWSSPDSRTTDALQDVAWGGSRYVAVGAFGRIITSADRTEWTNGPVPKQARQRR